MIKWADNSCFFAGEEEVEGDPEELVLQRQDLHNRLHATEVELVKSKYKLARWGGVEKSS
jgi:hypothetical protein